MLANNMIRAIVFVNDESTIVKAIHSRYCLHKVGLCGKYQEIFPFLLQSTPGPHVQNVTKHLIEKKNVDRFFLQCADVVCNWNLDEDYINYKSMCSYNVI